MFGCGGRGDLQNSVELIDTRLRFPPNQRVYSILYVENILATFDSYTSMYTYENGRPESLWEFVYGS